MLYLLSKWVYLKLQIIWQFDITVDFSDAKRAGLSFVIGG